MTPDKTWHDISAIAFWDEYAQLTKEGKPTAFWKNKSHIMLAKCAEALALRRAFPIELSGLYTKEEMQQDMDPDLGGERKLSDTQRTKIELLLNGDTERRKKLLEYAQVGAIKDILPEMYDEIIDVFKKKQVQSVGE